VLTPDDRVALHELAPVLRRAIALDPRSLARIKLTGEAAMVLVRLPFGVLVSRTVRTATTRDEPVDVAVRAEAALAWLDDEASPQAPPPPAENAAWRTGLPPDSGWRRLDTVPDDVVRGLVRRGAQALKDAAERAGVPGAQPRAEVADALLDTVVLTVNDEDGRQAEVTLRTLGAVTRMGFLPRGGSAHVDVSGRWIRVVAEYGSVYLERAGGLVLR
jgi:hypothetical protein